MIPKNAFHIVFREDEIEELHRRIQNSRQPKVSSGDDWSLGTVSDYLEALLDYWGNRYDWKRKVNCFFFRIATNRESPENAFVLELH